jgi:hypothetical protein
LIVTIQTKIHDFHNDFCTNANCISDFAPPSFFSGTTTALIRELILTFSSNAAQKIPDVGELMNLALLEDSSFDPSNWFANCNQNQNSWLTLLEGGWERSSMVNVVVGIPNVACCIL